MIIEKNYLWAVLLLFLDLKNLFLIRLDFTNGLKLYYTIYICRKLIIIYNSLTSNLIKKE